MTGPLVLNDALHFTMFHPIGSDKIIVPTYRIYALEREQGHDWIDILKGDGTVRRYELPYGEFGRICKNLGVDPE
jgi:hypothetical protein